MRTVALVPAAVLILAGLAGCAAPEPVRAEISVTGMHCDGCSSAIEDELGRIDGVHEAAADWEAGRAVAVFDPGTVSEDLLRAAVEGLGYEVRGISVGPQGD